MPIIPIYRQEIPVRPDHLDGMNHVNNVHYVQWMQDIAVEHSVANGWYPDRYLATGTAWFARRHTVDYTHPAVLGDTLIAETWITEMKNVSCLRRYRFLRQSDLREIALAETKWAFVNLATGRPMKILPELMASFVATTAGNEAPAQ